MVSKVTKYSSVSVGAVTAAILASVLYFEGGYVNDPQDPGGETKYGITVKTARAYGYTGPMKSLPLDTAKAIYTIEYVNKPHYDKIIPLSPAVAHKLVDAGVNAGVYRSTKWFQKSLNALNRDGQDYKNIEEDGILGDTTVAAFKSLIAKRGEKQACELVLKAMDANQGAYYMSLTKLKKYTVGWIDKRIQNVPLDKCVNYSYDPSELSEESDN